MIGLLCLFLLFPIGVQGAEAEGEPTEEESGIITESDADSWTMEIFQEVKLDKLDEFTLDELPEKMTFSQLAQGFWQEGVGSLSADRIVGWVTDLFFYELASSKTYFLQMLCFTVVFAVIREVMRARTEYISQMGFIIVYAAMITLLMKSFLLIAEVAEDGIVLMTNYLSALIPAYATTLLLSGNAVSAGAFYETAFILVTILEWAVRIFFVPGIHIYLLLRFLDQLFEENRFSRLADLLESGIRAVMRAAIAAVVGINCIQSLLTPAKDRMTESVVIQSISVIPGVGKLTGSAGDILLSCGMLIKNSVGAAALIVLLAIWALPIMKVFLFTFLYRGMSAIVQPVADRKLVECIHSTSKASELYLKLLQDSMLIFFLTVSMVTASTSFVF